MELVIYNPTEEQLLESYEISFNHEEIKKELAARLEKYNGLVYTEANIKAAKTDRANLNKFKEAIEDKRKEIKKACLKPCEDFEAKIKEIVAMIDKPILAIDTQIKDYEQIVKDEKLQGIKQYFADHVGALAELVPFDEIYNRRWMNATYKEADIQKEITDLFIKVEADLKVITDLQSEYELQMKDTYLKNFDLSAALSEKKRLEEQAAKLSEHRRQQAKKAAQRQQQAPAPAPPTPEPAPPVEVKQPSAQDIQTKPQEKVYTINFRATGTEAQLKALSQFMAGSGIKFGKIPSEERQAV